MSNRCEGKYQLVSIALELLFSPNTWDFHFLFYAPSVLGPCRTGVQICDTIKSDGRASRILDVRINSHKDECQESVTMLDCSTKHVRTGN